MTLPNPHVPPAGSGRRLADALTPKIAGALLIGACTWYYTALIKIDTVHAENVETKQQVRDLTRELADARETNEREMRQMHEDFLGLRGDFSQLNRTLLETKR